MRPPTVEIIADRFILHAIQEWGDPPADRIKAVQQVLDAAGIKASATCWPVFGGIWPKPCVGPEGEAATAWLKELTDTMQRGRFEEESAHVVRMIKARKEVTHGTTNQ
ncbi:MAG: hypothetical protein U1B30_15885 [Pseudomonadota bacterium]|nr:hypothetical protein [Pseudomonadota bacterium]